jgi:hypothetical protein
LQLGPASEVFQDALNGPLADSQLFADIAAGEPFGLELKDQSPIFGEQRAEFLKNLVGVGDFERRVDLDRDLLGPAAVAPEGFFAVHVLFAAGGSSIFVDYLVLRSPSEEGDKVPRVLEVGQAMLAANSPEKASPDTLKEVERVKPGTEETRELPPHDETNFRLVAPQEFTRCVFVSGLDLGEKGRDIASLVLSRFADRHDEILPSEESNRIGRR